MYGWGPESEQGVSSDPVLPVPRQSQENGNIIPNKNHMQAPRVGNTL